MWRGETSKQDGKVETQGTGLSGEAATCRNRAALSEHSFRFLSHQLWGQECSVLDFQWQEAKIHWITAELVSVLRSIFALRHHRWRDRSPVSDYFWQHDCGRNKPWAQYWQNLPLNGRLSIYLSPWPLWINPTLHSLLTLYQLLREISIVLDVKGSPMFAS